MLLEQIQKEKQPQEATECTTSGCQRMGGGQVGRELCSSATDGTRYEGSTKPNPRDESWVAKWEVATAAASSVGHPGLVFGTLDDPWIWRYG